MATIYMSPDPYYKAFEEVIDLRKFDLHKHRTAGLCLAHSNKRLFLGGMAPGTPGAKIPRWRSRFKGAWLIKDISHDGLPIVSSAPFSQQVHDQMNKHWDFTTVANYL